MYEAQVTLLDEVIDINLIACAFITGISLDICKPHMSSVWALPLILSGVNKCNIAAACWACDGLIFSLHWKMFV